MAQVIRSGGDNAFSGLYIKTSRIVVDGYFERFDIVWNRIGRTEFYLANDPFQGYVFIGYLILPDDKIFRMIERV